MAIIYLTQVTNIILFPFLHTHKHINTHTHTHIITHISLHTHTHTITHTHPHTHTITRKSLHTHTHTHTHHYTLITIHTHTHTAPAQALPALLWTAVPGTRAAGALPASPGQSCSLRLRQSWALSVFFSFSLIKNDFLHFLSC